MVKERSEKRKPVGWKDKEKIWSKKMSVIEVFSIIVKIGKDISIEAHNV